MTGRFDPHIQRTDAPEPLATNDIEYHQGWADVRRFGDQHPETLMATDMAGSISGSWSVSGKDEVRAMLAQMRAGPRRLRVFAGPIRPWSRYMEFAVTDGRIDQSPPDADGQITLAWEAWIDGPVAHFQVGWRNWWRWRGRSQAGVALRLAWRVVSVPARWYWRGLCELAEDLREVFRVR
jgi:hypothetical protein